MQKKLLSTLLLLVLSFALVSCSDGSSGGDDTTVTPLPPEEQEQEPTSDGKASVSFTNNSSYTVNVFVNAHRKLGGSVLVSVPARGKATTKLSPSATASGDAFYFEYIIPIGSVDFPYFSFNSSKGAVISADKTNTITIDELTSCPTKSSYLVIENQTTAAAYLINGSSILTPEAQTSYYIESGASGVFLLGQNDEAIYYQNTALLKLRTGTQDISLPDISFTLGNVYVVTVTNSGASLKSVSPFDVDTQKQIWSFNDSTFLTDAQYAIRPVMRPAYRISDGSLVLGTLKSDETKIGLMPVDVYGKHDTVYSAAISNSNFGTLEESLVLDFTQQSDGSIVMLLENICTLNDETTYHEMLVCYNFYTSTLLWSLTFQTDYANYMAQSAVGTTAFYVNFYSDSANSLYRMEDNKVAVVGSVDTGSAMYPFLTVVDATALVAGAEETLSLHNYLATAEKSEGDAQSYFTAVYYDGSDFYLCGFSNCDFSYADQSYTGVVYKCNGDLTACEKIYEKERCLLLCIDGVESRYYICGEYCDNGTILKGCYLSSAMVAQNAAPALHVSARPYCWFDQLCCYNGSVVLHGVTSNDKAGEEAPLPFVAAYNDSGKLLWQNTSYTAYTQTYSLVPNAIGTYILQLAKATSSTLHYVSADLLGNE